jgi:hypothetical protein
MRPDFVLRESKCAFIGEPMLFREFEIHDVPVLSGVQKQIIVWVVYVVRGNDYKRLAGILF